MSTPYTYAMSEVFTPEVVAWMMSPRSADQVLPTLEQLLQRPTWMKQAACRGQDTSLFFPSKGPSPARVARVRALCAGCPVREECLDYAITTEHIMGTWGGLTERERRPMRASRGAA